MLCMGVYMGVLDGIMDFLYAKAMYASTQERGDKLC